MAYGDGMCSWGGSFLWDGFFVWSELWGGLWWDFCCVWSFSFQDMWYLALYLIIIKGEAVQNLFAWIYYELQICTPGYIHWSEITTAGLAVKQAIYISIQNSYKEYYIINRWFVFHLSRSVSNIFNCYTFFSAHSLDNWIQPLAGRCWSFCPIRILLLGTKKISSVSKKHWSILSASHITGLIYSRVWP